jgi:hypothetical protein
MSSRMNEADQLAGLFRKWGASDSQAEVMARQLAKRADQIAAQRGLPREQALADLLRKAAEGRAGIAPGPSPDRAL